MRLNVNRRRAERPSLAVWTARYRLDPSQPWCSLRVLDVAETGVGLELHGPVQSNGASLILDLEQRDLPFHPAERQSRLDKLGFAGVELDNRGSIGAELPAVVRHTVETTDGYRSAPNPRTSLRSNTPCSSCSSNEEPCSRPGSCAVGPEHGRRGVASGVPVACTAA